MRQEFFTNLQNNRLIFVKTKPLIPLQQEKDKSSGKKSLTCYLFPQEHINRYRGTRSDKVQ